MARKRGSSDLPSLVVIRVVAGLGAAAMAVALLARAHPLEAFLDAPFHYAYRGLEWVRPLPAPAMRAVAVAMAASGVALALGIRTRIAAAVTTLLGTYFFLLDSLYYESTVYFVLLVLALFAIARGRMLLLLFRFQAACVYTFSGISKLDADWLSGRTFHVMAPRYPLYVAGSWAGLLFDLAVGPLLFVKRTRPFALAALVAFHVHNAIVFPMGLVPWIMLAAATVFLPPDYPRRLGLRLARPGSRWVRRSGRVARGAAVVWIAVQLVIPLRRLTADGEPYFDELGFRFTWAMRSRIKGAYADFEVHDRATGTRLRYAVGAGMPRDLAARIASDPHALWQAAREMARGRDVAVYADCWAWVNGRPAGRLVDPNVDLVKQRFPLFGTPAWVRRSPPPTPAP